MDLDRGVFRIYYTVSGWRSLGSYTVDGDRLLLFNDPMCQWDTGEYTWQLDDGLLTLTEIVLEEDQMDDPQDPGSPRDKTELLERIHRSRAALEAMLRPLSEAQLIAPGAEGWSIKDHLAHLATWELGIVGLLRRRPRFAAMQVQEAVSQGKREEEINELIYQRHANLSLAQVLDEFQDAHRQMLETLEALSEEDLLKPYAAYVPDGSDQRQDPVAYWVIGNTYGHFDEHLDYIRSQFQKR